MGGVAHSVLLKISANLTSYEKRYQIPHLPEDDTLYPKHDGQTDMNTCDRLTGTISRDRTT